MRFLICLRGEELSRKTLHFGALLASRLSTDITVLYVATGVRRSFSTETAIAREKMSEWAMESTGDAVLRHAYEHLKNMGLIQLPEGRADLKEEMFPVAGDAFEMKIVGRGGENVSFRLREGDALEEILAEMRSRRYDLLVIGGGKKQGSMMEKLLQFSPSSVLIVKNPRDIRYRVLAATDATPPAHRAELLAIKTASVLKMELTFLAVIESERMRGFMEKHLERMANLCNLKKVPYRVQMVSGNVVKETAAAAGDDHIIFLGRSRRGTLKKLFLRSKAIKIANDANCPILLVK